MKSKKVDEAKRAQAQSLLGFDAYGVGADAPDPVERAIHALTDHVLAIDAQLKMAQQELVRLGSVLPEVELPTLDACMLDACETKTNDVQHNADFSTHNT